MTQAFSSIQGNGGYLIACTLNPIESAFFSRANIRCHLISSAFQDCYQNLVKRRQTLLDLERMQIVVSTMTVIFPYLNFQMLPRRENKELF